MRRKIGVIGAGETVAAVAADLVALDHADVLLLDDDELAKRLAADAPEGQLVLSAGWQDLAGAHVLVGLGGRDVDAAAIVEHCPDAIIVVAGADAARRCAVVVEGTRLPRGRVVGVEGADPARVTEVVEAILHDRRRTVRAIVRCDGEHGHEGYVEAGVQLGAVGVREIIE